MKSICIKTWVTQKIATVKTGDSSQIPIIWLGDFQDVYYNYDIIQIPFLVYNPANTAQAEVRLYKNDIEIDGSPRTIKDFSDFTYWQIADAELNKENYYSIACGLTPETSEVREIKFRVIPDPNRDMTIVKQSNLKLNFDPAGRSNSEPATKRQSWTYGEGDSQIKAIFDLIGLTQVEVVGLLGRNRLSNEQLIHEVGKLQGELQQKAQIF